MLRCFFFSFCFCFFFAVVLFCLLSLASFFERGWEQRGEGGSGDHAWEREINQRMRDQQGYRVSLSGTAELQIHRNRWEDGKQQVELMKDGLIRKQEEKRREVELCRNMQKQSKVERTWHSKGRMEAAPWWDASWENDTYLIPQRVKERGQTTLLIDWQCLRLSFTIFSYSSTLAWLPAMEPRAES